MSPENVQTGLVPKMSLKEYVRKFKDENPDITASDADTAAFYLRKSPGDIKRLDTQSQKLANALFTGGEEGIRTFYHALGSKAMEGVSLANAPAFQQPLLKAAKTRYKIGTPGDMSKAHVSSSDPTSIYADEPELVTPSIQAHELTHVYQLSLREAMKHDVSEDKPGGIAPASTYDYGGWQSLIDARNKGKTIRDFTDEQQASMIEDYTNLQTKLHDPSYQTLPAAKKVAMLNEWDQANQALAPYLRQLIGQPKLDDPKGDIFHLQTLDLKPPSPPGPPPAALTGTAVPLPEMGGTSVYTNLGTKP